MAVALAASRVAMTPCASSRVVRCRGDRGGRTVHTGHRVTVARVSRSRHHRAEKSRHRVSCAIGTHKGGFERALLRSRSTATHAARRYRVLCGTDAAGDGDDAVGVQLLTETTEARSHHPVCPKPDVVPDGLLPKDSQRVVRVCAFAMLLASADRTIFSLAALAIASDLNLPMTTVGSLQSSFLWGYGMTQVIGGVAADKAGGARVLLGGLLCWSVAVALVPVASGTQNPVPWLLTARFLFGAASGVAVPAVSSAIAKYVPANSKSVGLSTVFAAFNCGSAFGLALAGGVIATYGWQTVFGVFGVVGVVWAVSGFFLLPAAARKGPEKSAESGLGLDELESIQQKKENNFSRAKSTPPWMWSQLASLAWCHMCVNFGFFQLQSWLPAYLARDLGLTLGNSGLVAAFPWLVCAIFSFTSGKLADAAIRNGWERWKVRRGAMRVATVGPATALAGLSMLSASGAAGSVWATSLSVVLVTATLATQAVAIAGFHAYLQDVAPAKAGAFLGVTNTLGVFAGIAANVTTGVILEKTGKFTLVFLVTAFVYLSSGAVWERNMKGRVLFA